MLEKVDLYARSTKQATKTGGIFSVVALGVAAAYAVWLVIGFITSPATTSSTVEWADTQGPWPMEIRCVSEGGCWVSNAHNKWSSNSDKVAAAQQSCFYLNQGQETTINFTFTQDPHAGLVLAWNASSNSTSTPGSGVTVRADINCPSCPGGVFAMWTPALGGIYLANLVETTNSTSTVAPFRREWFLTYVSEGSGLQPWAPCSANISASAHSSYTQASIRIMSAWYRVQFSKQTQWLQLLGNAGGGTSVSMTAGGLLATAFQVLLAWFTWNNRPRNASAARSAPDHAPDTPGRAVVPQQADRVTPWDKVGSEDSLPSTPKAGTSKAGKKGHSTARAIPVIAGEAW